MFLYTVALGQTWWFVVDEGFEATVLYRHSGERWQVSILYSITINWQFPTICLPRDFVGILDLLYSRVDSWNKSTSQTGLTRGLSWLQFFFSSCSFRSDWRSEVNPGVQQQHVLCLLYSASYLRGIRPAGRIIVYFVNALRQRIFYSTTYPTRLVPHCFRCARDLFGPKGLTQTDKCPVPDRIYADRVLELLIHSSVDPRAAKHEQHRE